MRKKILISLLLIGSHGLFGQVSVVKKANPKVTGKEKELLKAPKKITVSNFSIFFEKTSWVTAGNKAGRALNLVGIDNGLAQELANESYQYMIEKFGSFGIEVTAINAEELKNSMLLKKKFKKGKATLMNGESYEIIERRPSDGPSYTAAVANGVNIAFEGPKQNAYIGVNNWPALTGDFDLSICPTITFVESEGRASETSFTVANIEVSTSSVVLSSNPILRIKAGKYGNGSSVRYFGKKQSGINLEPIELENDNDAWITGANKTEELYGDSFKLTVDPIIYKKTVGEMLKLYIDQVVEGIVNTVWNR